MPSASDRKPTPTGTVEGALEKSRTIKGHSRRRRAGWRRYRSSESTGVPAPIPSRLDLAGLRLRELGAPIFALEDERDRRQRQQANAHQQEAERDRAAEEDR